MDGKPLKERTHKIYLNKQRSCIDWQSLEIVQIGHDFVRVRHKVLVEEDLIDKQEAEAVE